MRHNRGCDLGVWFVVGLLLLAMGIAGNLECQEYVNQLHAAAPY